MNVSIVIPIFNPDRNALKKLIQAVKKQKFKGKIEILEIEENMGFAKQINLGIKKSKYDIVVELPQDCIPANKYWLKNLVEPFKKKKIKRINRLSKCRNIALSSNNLYKKIKKNSSIRQWGRSNF